MHLSHIRRGFTIIELLVTIAIIGVILAILLPALGGSVQLTRRTVSLSNLRTIGQFVQHYVEANDEAYPWAMRGTNTCGVPIQFSPIWQMSMQWPITMHDIVKPEELREIQLSPGVRRDGTGNIDTCGAPPSYTYSMSFLADPRLWGGDSVADESMLRAVTMSKVAYPTNKVLMWDWELPFLNHELQRSGPDLDESTPMLFADGHGADRRPSEATEPVANPFGEDAILPLARLHNTRDGVQGRDY